ncbi:S-layer protein [Thermococcus sp. M39]|uniref:S-layer protein n=1 Tax=Thermococcus sp. M39 TaxID=1638262 RepID=UPI00143C832C|nr:S-layer protein [Thermococcus sp. M39]NJE07455.1 S-layer protein [Thermococcus sp. M39]
MKVRKIAALAVGAAMVGATMGFASAQANLPGKEFFVKDGAPNVKIVVGSQAAAMDVASAADIALALGSLLYTEKEVEASGVSVLVKKDITVTPDPIPVYSNYYSDYNASPTAEDWTQLPQDAWYNGAAYNTDYAGWKSYIGGGYAFEIEDRDSIGSDQMIDWDIKITGIKFYKGDSEWSPSSDYGPLPKDADVTLYVPAGALNVTLNYELYNATYKYSDTDDVWGTPITDTKYVIDDDTPATMDFDGKTYTLNTTEVYEYGIGAKDTFTIFGNEYYVLSVDATAKTLTYGHDHGQVWFHVGDVKEFDGYKIKAVDISVGDTPKALFEITAPDGRSDLIIISVNDGEVDISTKSDKFSEGEVVLKLDDTFVGIDGNLIAQLEVRTNVVTVESGKENNLINGWTAYFTFGKDKDNNDVITRISLVNAEAKQGSTIDILGVYKMDYVVKVQKKDIDDDDKEELAVKAEIDFEPVKRVYDTKELKVGDELEGWTIDQIKGGTYTEVTVMHPTEPITYLDTEIDPENIDSNLILVGGPVANAITKYLVDNGYSTVDWYNSAGDIEYIEDYNGYGILIVAGKDRYATREAAKQLMEYLANL